MKGDISQENFRINTGVRSQLILLLQLPADREMSAYLPVLGVVLVTG